MQAFGEFFNQPAGAPGRLLVARVTGDMMNRGHDGETDPTC